MRIFLNKLTAFLLMFGLATLWYTSHVAPLAGYSRLILPINLTIQPNRATFC